MAILLRSAFVRLSALALPPILPRATAAGFLPSEAVYKQGRKDGAREVFEQMDGLKPRIPYRNPGHPKKRKK